MKVLQHVACRVNTWFAICDKWAFWNELLGLTGRHMGELNFLTAPCFKIENCFLTIQIEKEKKMFPQRNRRKSWEESPAVKTQAPETNYILVLNLHGHDLQFLWKIFLLLSSAERLLSEGEQQLLLEHSHSCTSTAAGSDCRDTEPHSLSAVSNMQFEDSNLECDFDMHLSDLWAQFPLSDLGVELLTTGGQSQQSGGLGCRYLNGMGCRYLNPKLWSSKPWTSYTITSNCAHAHQKWPEFK